MFKENKSHTDERSGACERRETEWVGGETHAENHSGFLADKARDEGFKLVQGLRRAILKGTRASVNTVLENCNIYKPMMIEIDVFDE